MAAPLAERIRPTRLEEHIGQDHLTGEGKPLHRAITTGRVPSFILWGPPGVGKTTLAQIIAETLERPFHALSAVNSGVKDVRETIKKAESERFFNKPNPILFIDEIHRFSKSQQDSLLGAVEKGTVTLIGATTENPSFEVIPALRSRCQVFILNALDNAALRQLADRALQTDFELKKREIKIEEDNLLFRYAAGDGRKLLNILEIISDAFEPEETIKITDELVSELVSANVAKYDKGGELHYDIISAFIKSIRGSDPDAAVYWLARMIEGGEDVKFIARRLLIHAAEDIGLANPNALLLAQATFDAVNVIGHPESRIILSQATIYLATSPKSNSAYMAIGDAQQLVRETGDLPVPLHLRNSPTKLMKDIGYGKNYKYAHNYPGNFVKQDFLPKEIGDKKIYTPQNNPQEARISERLKNWWGERFNR